MRSDFGKRRGRYKEEKRRGELAWVQAGGYLMIGSLMD